MNTWICESANQENPKTDVQGIIDETTTLSKIQKEATPSNVNNKNEQIRELILALAHFSKMQVLIEFKIFWEKFKQNNLPWQSTSVLYFKTNWPQHFAK